MKKLQKENTVLRMLSQVSNVTTRAQLDVIENRRSEAWVFETYVAGVSEEDKDENLFFACRDAARYAAGKLTAEELMGCEVNEEEKEEKLPRNTKTSELEILRKRVDALEALISKLAQAEEERKRISTISFNAPDINRADFINQTAALALVGCSKGTLKNWAAKGLIHAYQRGNKLWYNKRELEQSPVVISHQLSRS